MTNAEVGRLLGLAAQAPTQAEQARLVAEADRIRNAAVAQHNAAREMDFAAAIVQDHLTPVRVHEHHTAATDWLGGLDVTGGAGVEQEMIAQGSLWFERTAGVKPWREEWTEQARGQARKLAGAYGLQAEAAEQAFLTHVGSLYDRELRSGVFALAASGVPQVGEQGNPVTEGTVGPSVPSGLPLERTTSERAPVIQAMEHNDSSGIHDAQFPNSAEADNGGADRRTASINGRTASMQHATCPTCQGGGKVAVRRQAASGLPQIQEVVDSHDNPHAEQQPDWSVAFPWEMPPNSMGTIQEAEQQIAQREKLKGASLHQQAQAAGEAAYNRVLAAARHQAGGYDASGWLGDMGAGGYGPGQQDGGNPGNADNISEPDPVYGYGGDQGDRPLKPYGADEANDKTNNPGSWQPGQPTQADVGGRGQTVGQPTASLDQDPQIQAASRYIRQRRAYLQNGGR